MKEVKNHCFRPKGYDFESWQRKGIFDGTLHPSQSFFQLLSMYLSVKKNRYSEIH